MTEGKTNKKIDTAAIEEHIRGILVALATILKEKD